MSLIITIVLLKYQNAFFFLGSGSAITSVLSLSVTANLIGKDTDCGAFIYSSVTFSDKLINGLVIIGIEYM